MHPPIDDAECREQLRTALTLGRQRWGLPSEAARRLLEGARLDCYVEGQPIEVTDARHATVLVSGAVRVECHIGTKRPLTVRIARPGDFIGAGWVGSRGHRDEVFRGVAHETSTVAVLSPEVMTDVLSTPAITPELFMQFLGYVQRALCRQIYDRSMILNLRVAQALLYQLRILAKEFPQAHRDGTVIGLHLGDGSRVAPRILASFLGCTESTLSREFWQLVRHDLVGFVGDLNQIILRRFYVNRIAV